MCINICHGDASPIHAAATSDHGPSCHGRLADERDVADRADTVDTVGVAGIADMMGMVGVADMADMADVLDTVDLVGCGCGGLGRPWTWQSSPGEPGDMGMDHGLFLVT